MTAKGNSAIKKTRKLLLLAASTLNLLVLSSQQAATDETPTFDWPVDCKLVETCWVARYMDRSSNGAHLDHACGKRTQNNHKGTDIALSDTGEMARGVSVKAAADGTVFRLRGNMEDGLLQSQGADAIKGRECGNAIILQHAGGWQTQYCHLQQNSLLVRVGDNVEAGQPIALIGLSGETEFPHLHFMVRAPQSENTNNRDIDPFDGGRFQDNRCDASDMPLWSHDVGHQTAALLPPVIDSAQRQRSNMWDPQSTQLPATSPALVVQARGFHALAGDMWRIRLMDPSGQVRVNREIEQKTDRQRILAFAGIRKPAAGFKTGRWSASVELLRGERSLGKQTTTVLVEQP